MRHRRPTRARRPAVADPADPQDPANQSGGWYELAVEVQTGDKTALDAMVVQLWRLAGVEPAPGGHVLRLPDGPRVVVCTYVLVEEGGRSGWIVLGLPLGSLARADPRVTGSPSGDDLGHSWRRPLDAWLASLAARLFDLAPFSLALVGLEVSGEMSGAEAAAGLPAEHDHVGIITVTDGPTFHPATG